MAHALQRSLLSLALVLAAGSASAQVQDWRNPFYRAAPELAPRGDDAVRGTEPVETGRVSRLSGLQRAAALRLLEPVQDALSARTGRPARPIGLRAGAVDGRRVLCGTVRGPDGALDRFIARPGTATLESEVPAESFGRAWRAIGCG